MIADAEVTVNVGAGAPAGATGDTVCDPPALRGPISIWACTISIQNIADIRWASAFGSTASPTRKSMLSVPPPGIAEFWVSIVSTSVNRMVAPAMWSFSRLFGLSSSFWVIAGTLDRSWGIRGVPAFVTVWLSNGIGLPPTVEKGVIALVPLGANGICCLAGADASLAGPPAIDAIVPCALMVVPCGMEAIRATVVTDWAGSVVGGTITQIPGSR